MPTIEMQDQKDVFNDVLSDLAAEDPRVVALTADMGTRILPEFMARYPERFYNLGVAEQNLISHAAGLAVGGLIPFVTTIAAFLSMRAFEQIRTDVAYPGLAVKIVGTGGGLSYGVLGPTHFALEDLALLRTIPGLTVLSPADGPETAWAVRRAHQIEGPVYIRLDRGKTPTVYQGQNLGDHRGGQADWLPATADSDAPLDVCLIATGVMVHEAIMAAEQLAAEGVQAAVVNVHTLKPLDEDAIAHASARARAVVTVEDHTVIGGLGSAVATCLMTHPRAHRGPVRILGSPDLFPHITGDATALRAAYGLTGAAIARSAHDVLS